MRNRERSLRRVGPVALTAFHSDHSLAASTVGKPTWPVVSISDDDLPIAEAEIERHTHLCGFRRSEFGAQLETGARGCRGCAMIRLKEDVAWIGVGKVDTSQNIVIVLHLATAAGCLSFAGFISITLRVVSYSASPGSTSRPLNLLLNLLMTRFGRNKEGELATAGAEEFQRALSCVGNCDAERVLVATVLSPSPATNAR